MKNSNTSRNIEEDVNTHSAVEGLDGLDRGLVFLEVDESETAALAVRTLFLCILSFVHLDLAADP